MQKNTSEGKYCETLEIKIGLPLYVKANTWEGGVEIQDRSTTR